MASIIRIKRSSTSGNPSTLGAGELAYSALTDNGSNGGDRLYIGMGTETSGNAVNHVVIGGKYYTGLVDAGGAGGTLTTNAKSIPVLSATGTIDKWLVGNLQLAGNALTSTNTNGDITITPNGTGKTVISNLYVGDTATTLQEYIFDQVGGTITAGTGITSTVNDAGNTTTLSITNTGVTAGSYGSATSVPTFTVNAQGQLTSAGSAAISTTLNIAGGTGTAAVALGTDTLTFTGGTGITTAAAKAGTADSLTIAIDTAVVTTLTGTQTLTNKTISGSNNTLSNIANSSLTNSSVTIGSTAISLGGTATTIAGLSSVTSTSFVGALTGNASTATTLATARNINGVSFNGSADITVTAAAGTLSGTTLNATVVASSLTSVGTIATGVWQGTTIGVAYGGTGTSNGSITGTGALTFTAAAGNNNVNLVPTGTGIVDAGGKRVGNAADPTQSSDLATKAYVDGLSNGLDVKQSVRAASTTPLTATYSNGTGGVGATLTNANTQAALTLDSIAVAVGDRVLIKDQAAPLQNGVYVVTTVGSASTNWVLTRAADFDNSPGLEVGPGVFFFVEDGTTQADNGYVVSTNSAIIIGTTDITFSQFSGAGQITAGAGLTKSGNTLDVVGTANRISVATDSIDIASTYVGQNSITTLGTIGTGTWQGTIVGPTYGGTGVNNGSNTVTLAGSVTHAGAFARTFTATATTNVTLPTTGTLATLAGAEALSNKTITASSFSGTTVTASGDSSFTSTTDATSLGTAAVVLAGGLSIAKKAVIGTTLYIGSAATSVTLTSPSIIAKNTAATYAQIAMINSAATGSSDFAAYADNGTDTAGWADMGMTSSGFNDAAYTLTGKNDGYFLVQAVSGTGLTGNMVLGTGGNGTTNDIVFGTGGFLLANEKMRFVHATGTLAIKTTTASSSTTTGALTVAGGVGIAGVVNVGSNIVGAGAATSTLDGFNIDGGTY